MASAILNPITKSARALPRSLPSKVRPFSSSAARLSAPPRPPKSAGGLKVIHVFSAFAALGIGATSYGLYQFYQTFTTYPSPVRTQLRAALRSAVSGEFERSSTSFQKAYDLALELKAAGSLNLKETTGIAIRWGEMWEKTGDYDRAREAYELAFAEVKDAMTQGDSDSEGVKRGAGVALKIGDLWVDERKDPQAEKYYVWGVEELMRLELTESQKQKVADVVAGREDLPTSKEAKETAEDEVAWLQSVEVVGALERLGDLYSRTGKVAYAQPLLQQAIASLLPPPKKGGPPLPIPPIPTRCHAATLMNNLSATFIPPAGRKPTEEEIDQASRWSRQALTVAQSCWKEAQKNRRGKTIGANEPREEEECERVAVVGAFNLGKLSELSDDMKSAKNWYQKSGQRAARIGFVEGFAESRDALRRLEE